MSNAVTLIAVGIDPILLRQQLHALIQMQVTQDKKGNDTLEGIINMIENMLDIYDNYATKRNKPSTFEAFAAQVLNEKFNTTTN